MKKGLFMPNENWEYFENLSPIERGKLITILWTAHFGQDYAHLYPKLSERAKGYFDVLKNQMLRLEDSYQKFCEKQQSNGLKGGAPRGNSNASKVHQEDESYPQQPKTTQNNPNNPPNLTNMTDNNINNNNLVRTREDIHNLLKKSFKEFFEKFKNFPELITAGEEIITTILDFQFRAKTTPIKFNDREYDEKAIIDMWVQLSVDKFYKIAYAVTNPEKEIQNREFYIFACFVDNL